MSVKDNPSKFLLDPYMDFVEAHPPGPNEGAFSCVSLGFSPDKATFHFPSFATVSTFCPAKETVTFSPSFAVPQTGTETPC